MSVSQKHMLRLLYAALSITLFLNTAMAIRTAC